MTTTITAAATKIETGYPVFITKIKLDNQIIFIAKRMGRVLDCGSLLPYYSNLKEVY